MTSVPVYRLSLLWDSRSKAPFNESHKQNMETMKSKANVVMPFYFNRRPLDPFWIQCQTLSDQKYGRTPRSPWSQCWILLSMKQKSAVWKTTLIKTEPEIIPSSQVFKNLNVNLLKEVFKLIENPQTPNTLLLFIHSSWNRNGVWRLTRRIVGMSKESNYSCKVFQELLLEWSSSFIWPICRLIRKQILPETSQSVPEGGSHLGIRHMNTELQYWQTLALQKENPNG